MVISIVHISAIFSKASLKSNIEMPFQIFQFCISYLLNLNKEDASYSLKSFVIVYFEIFTTNSEISISNIIYMINVSSM